MSPARTGIIVAGTGIIEVGTGRDLSLRFYAKIITFASENISDENSEED